MAVLFKKLGEVQPQRDLDVAVGCRTAMFSRSRATIFTAGHIGLSNEWVPVLRTWFQTGYFSFLPAVSATQMDVAAMPISEALCWAAAFRRILFGTSAAAAAAVGCVGLCVSKTVGGSRCSTNPHVG